jgi:hypothetical protein
MMKRDERKCQRSLYLKACCVKGGVKRPKYGWTNIVRSDFGLEEGWRNIFGEARDHFGLMCHRFWRWVQHKSRGITFNLHSQPLSEVLSCKWKRIWTVVYVTETGTFHQLNHTTINYLIHNCWMKIRMVFGALYIHSFCKVIVLLSYSCVSSDVLLQDHTQTPLALRS